MSLVDTVLVGAAGAAAVFDAVVFAVGVSVPEVPPWLHARPAKVAINRAIAHEVRFDDLFTKISPGLN